MLVGKNSLSTEIQTFLHKLKSLDLGPIAYKLMHPEEGYWWTRSQTRQAIARYLMFLLLIHLYPNSQLVPTQEIDRVWHHHILDTAKYTEDCQMLFGRVIHHFPYFGLNGRIDRCNWTHAFAQTQALFEAHFGKDAIGLKHSLNSTSQLIEMSKFQQPAACEPLRKKKRRPRVRMEVDISCTLIILPSSQTTSG